MIVILSFIHNLQFLVVAVFIHLILSVLSQMIFTSRICFILARTWCPEVQSVQYWEKYLQNESEPEFGKTGERNKHIIANEEDLCRSQS